MSLLSSSLQALIPTGLQLPQGAGICEALVIAGVEGYIVTSNGGDNTLRHRVHPCGLFT